MAQCLREVNSKDQAPTPREAPKIKSQTQLTTFGAWCLVLLWVLELGIWSFQLFTLCESFLDVFDNEPARLVGSHLGVIDDSRAEGDHQRGGGALAVALVAGGEIFIHALGVAALRALVQVCVEVK